ncbi:MAG: hypothetical protein ACREHG_00470 [Candidatus Saccharimonadales bacterium]
MTSAPSGGEYIRDEYKLVFDGYKFFVSIRFMVAAFAMSIQSALLTVYNQTAKENHLHGVVVFMVAMLFLFALIVIERRTIKLFKALLARGAELEFQMGILHGFFHRIDEISPKQFQFVATHTKGISLVYVGMFVLWITLLVATIIKV